MGGSRAKQSIKRQYMEGMMGSQPVRKICKNCGGDNVRADAWAVWDVERQKWELGEIFQHTFCGDCDGDTTIIDEPLSQ